MTGAMTRSAVRPRLPLDLDHRGCRPPEDFRFVHLLGARGRGPERPRGRRADDVAELVDAFGEAGREELHAIVVALDVVELAVAPPGVPRRFLFVLTCRRRRRLPIL